MNFMMFFTIAVLSNVEPYGFIFAALAVVYAAFLMRTTEGKIAVFLGATVLGSGSQNLSAGDVVSIFLFLLSGWQLLHLEKHDANRELAGFTRVLASVLLFAGAYGLIIGILNSANSSYVLRDSLSVFGSSLAFYVLGSLLQSKLNLAIQVVLIYVLTMSVSWTIYWAGLRNFMPDYFNSSLGVDPVFLALIAGILLPKRPTAGLLILGLSLALSVFSGSRLSFVFALLITLVNVLSSSRKFSGVIKAALFALPVLPALIFVGFSLESLINRYRVFESLLTSGIYTDSSWTLRVAATRNLYETGIQHAPFGLGFGLNHNFIANSPTGLKIISGSKLDSPISLLPELGILGFIVLNIFWFTWLYKLAREALLINKLFLSSVAYVATLSLFIATVFDSLETAVAFTALTFSLFAQQPVISRAFVAQDPVKPIATNIIRVK